MKLSQKLILGFVCVALLVAVVGYIAVGASQKALQKAIGENSATLARGTLDAVDRIIYRRIERWQSYSTSNPELKQAIIESNREFENLDNIQKYINEKDRVWRAAEKQEELPFMQELINNKSSKALRIRTNFYKEKYGQNVFSEVFVTNKFGANAAQTGKTTDYYQADERWWQNAKKDGLYVADVEYDESADVYSLALCMRIDGVSGNFLGVMKIVLNIQDIIDVLKGLEAAGYERKEYGRHAHKEYETTKFKLLTKDGKIIYSTEASEFLDDIPPKLLSVLHKKKGSTGYFIAEGDKPGEGEELFAHAYSKGYKDFGGLGWNLIVEHKTKEIFAPVAKLRARILIISLVVATLAVLLGFFISKTISSLVSELAATAAEIGRGKLDTRLEVRSKDEIGQLAGSFNKMAEDLQKTTTSIDRLNAANQQLQAGEQQLKAANQQLESEIADRKQAEEKIHQQNEFLNNVLESLTHPFYVINVEDYTIKIANSAARLGNFSEDLTCYALTYKRSQPCSGEHICPLEEVKRTKKSVVTEHIHYDEDGNPRNVEVHGYPIFDSAGNISQMIEYTLDITERKQAGEKLQKSEEKYKTLLENLPQGIFLKDRNSVYVSCNQNYARDLKIKPEEIAGRTDYEFYDKELAEKYRGDDKRIMEAGTTEDIEEKYIRNGQEMIVQTVKTPIKDEEGSIVGILGIFWDITDLKHAQEAIERLSKFPSENPNPVLRVQKDGKILYGNNAALSLLAKWKTKVGGAVPAKWRRLVDKAFESEKAISDDEEVNDRIFSFVVAPILDGDYVNLYARDITERKKAGEALEALNRELGDFVYIASHDLREPMRKISSFGELLKDSLSGNLNADDQENLEFMIDGANRMTAMVEGLLVYSRLNKNGAAFEAVDLNEIVEQLEQLELAELLEETDAAIEVPQPLPKVQAEPVQMRQLLQNLVINGIRYRREGIQPRIVIRAEQIADGEVKVEVEDNGIGIAKEYREDVFKMFRRLHSRQKYEGTGIGLAVCKKIVEKHNGQIGVESEAGAGSAFWFTLPVSESSEQEQTKLVSSLKT